MICKIRRHFVNTFTADIKDSLLNRDNLTQQIQMQLSQKQKTFSQFFLSFLKSIFIFKHFPKSDARISDVFPELPRRKNMGR